MMITAKDLHVFTARSNPINWEKPHANWEKFATAMVQAGVSLTVVECAYGELDHRCDDIEGERHIPVRAKTRVWNKENLLNVGVHRTPEAKYIAWIDADVIFRRPDWAMGTLHALQHYDVIQPWSDAYDLGPNDEHIAHHRSFCRQYFHRHPVVPTSESFWISEGGSNTYPHSGYAWAMTGQAFDWVGGLFELGGMGSGDHHMALALIGQGAASVPKSCSDAYHREVDRWANRAVRHINFNLGYVRGTIEHLFHGRKPDRGYQSRWDMFLRNGFDPLEDLKRNSHGVLEFASNKPELRHDFDLYLMNRNEDINSL